VLYPETGFEQFLPEHFAAVLAHHVFNVKMLLFHGSLKV
jgi:hypothetical protein